VKDIRLFGSVLWLYHTTTRRAIPSQRRVDYCSSTPHARFDPYGFGRAVSGTCTAFHAGITVFNLSMSIVHAEDTMRTDDRTHLAAHTFILKELQGNHILKIDQLTHFFLI
jgi:hypothetical protein